MKPIINVQFMRAIATLGVVAHHFSIQFFLISGSKDNWFYYLLHQIGPAGVDFFFLISGYIMWITTQEQTNRHPVMSFAYKRITRIYFGYWPYFLLALLIVAFFPYLVSDQVNYWGSFFLTEPNGSKLLIQVAWTLQYEFYFYGLFTLLLLFPRGYLLKTIFVMSTIIVLAQLFAYLPLGESELQKYIKQSFFLSPFCLEFFAGCLLGRHLKKHRAKRLWAFMLPVVGLLGFAIYFQEQVIHTSLIDNTYIVPRVLLYGTTAALVLTILIELEMRGRVLFKNFSVLFGGASYSMYLSHTLVIALVYALGWQLWLKENSQWPGLWMLFFMVLTIIYSLIHYIWIEKSLMSLAKHFHQRIFKPKPKPLAPSEN